MVRHGHAISILIPFCHIVRSVIELAWEVTEVYSTRCVEERVRRKALSGELFYANRSRFSEVLVLLSDVELSP